MEDDVYVYLNNSNKIVGITGEKSYAESLAQSECNVVKLNKKLKSKVDLNNIDISLDIVELYGNILNCDEENDVIDRVYELFYDMKYLSDELTELIEPIRSEHLKVILTYINNLYEDYVSDGYDDVSIALNMKTLVGDILKDVRE